MNAMRNYLKADIEIGASLTRMSLRLFKSVLVKAI